MVDLYAYGHLSDDVNTALSLLMEEYLAETKVELPAEKQYELLVFARYVLDHWRRMAELLKMMRQ